MKEVEAKACVDIKTHVYFHYCQTIQPEKIKGGQTFNITSNMRYIYYSRQRLLVVTITLTCIQNKIKEIIIDVRDVIMI